MTTSNDKSPEKTDYRAIGVILIIIALIRFFLGTFPHNLEVLYLIWLGAIIIGWVWIKPKNVKEKLLKFAGAFVPLLGLFWMSFYLDDVYDLSTDLKTPTELKTEVLELSFSAVNAENASINQKPVDIEDGRVQASVNLESGENKVEVVLTNKIGETLEESFEVFYLSPEIVEQRQTEADQKEAEKIAREEKKKQDALNAKIREKEALAGVCSRTYIDALLAPRSTDFPTKNATFDAEKNVYRISSYVDTVNDFNAPIRKRYYCEIAGVDLEAFTCQQHNCQWE